MNIFGIFSAIWVALGVSGFGLFFVSKNVRFKRRYFPWYVTLVGLLFIWFGLQMGLPLRLFFILVPAVALITFINVKVTKFCDNCGGNGHQPEVVLTG